MAADEVRSLPDALLAALIAAPAGSRELDAIVWLHLPEQEGHAWKHGGDKFAHAKQIAGCGFIPCYTASVDAALSLVPEEWQVSQMGEWDSPILRERGPWLCILSRRGDQSPLKPCWDSRCDHARTLPLAIVIACFRARDAGA